MATQLWQRETFSGLAQWLRIWVDDDSDEAGDAAAGGGAVVVQCEGDFDGVDDIRLVADVERETVL
jgi:hypothetical protein